MLRSLCSLEINLNDDMCSRDEKLNCIFREAAKFEHRGFPQSCRGFTGWWFVGLDWSLYGSRVMSSLWRRCPLLMKVNHANVHEACYRTGLSSLGMTKQWCQIASCDCGWNIIVREITWFQRFHITYASRNSSSQVAVGQVNQLVLADLKAPLVLSLVGYCLKGPRSLSYASAVACWWAPDKKSCARSKVRIW